VLIFRPFCGSWIRTPCTPPKAWRTYFGNSIWPCTSAWTQNRTSSFCLGTWALTFSKRPTTIQTVFSGIMTSYIHMHRDRGHILSLSRSLATAFVLLVVPFAEEEEGIGIVSKVFLLSLSLSLSSLFSLSLACSIACLLARSLSRSRSCAFFRSRSLAFFVSLSLCRCVSLSFCLCNCLSIYLSVCLSVCSSVHLSVCLSVSCSLAFSRSLSLSQPQSHTHSHTLSPRHLSPADRFWAFKAFLTLSLSFTPTHPHSHT